MTPPRRHPRGRASTRAFTLLELLIATAVGSVVLLVIQTTFFGALRLHNTTHARLDEDAVQQRGLALIQRDLAGLVLPTPPPSSGTPILAGELQTTSFSSANDGNLGERVTPDLHTSSGRIDGWNPFSEVQRVAYYLAPSTTGRGRDLIRAATRNLLPVQDTVPEPQVLLTGLESARLMFYDGTSWTDTWDSEATTSLPTGLRFSLTFLRPDSTQAASAPVDIVVPILVRTTTSQQQEEEEGLE